MEFEKEESYRRFIAYIKIQKIREIEKRENLTQEYNEVLKKLEMIRKGRYLAILGEENEEKMLYKKILDIIYEKYKEVSILNEEYEQTSQELYKKIRSTIDCYKLDKSVNKLQKQRKEEEQER